MPGKVKDRLVKKRIFMRRWLENVKKNDKKVFICLVDFGGHIDKG